MPLTPGEIVAGRFRIEELAGQGGMGAVFRARDLHTGRLVALKVLTATQLGQQHAERFAREIDLVAELRHPAIVSYIAHGTTTENRPFLVMEWLDGHDLSWRLRNGGLTLHESLKLLRNAASALDVAHQRGVIHRDLKPSNLFLRSGQVDGVTLLDFGIARSVDPEQFLTRTGIVLGTPDYMAPEQARGSHVLTPAADIFALGCLFFECLIGRPPFVADHVAMLLARVLFDEPPRLRELRPELPVSVEVMLARMLAKPAEQRYANAAALLQAIAALGNPAELCDSPSPLRQAKPGRAMLVSEELLLMSVVVALDVTTMSCGTDRTLAAEAVDSNPVCSPSLRSAVAQLGARLLVLSDGVLIATVVQERGAVRDQAAAAARTALLLKERLPQSMVSLATGPGAFASELPIGVAYTRARRLAAASPQPVTSSVLIDEVTMGLLEANFHLTPASELGALLHGERVDVDEARPLLGQPTPCVGREGELAQLDILFGTCISESRAQGVLVTAPAGVGKSRLRHELLRRFEFADRTILPRVLSGRGEPHRGGAAYGVLGQLLDRLLGTSKAGARVSRQLELTRRVAEFVASEDTQRIAEFLGEACDFATASEGLEGSDLLRAARRDPRLMSDQIQQAFIDLLRGLCRTRPLLLVIEDIHACDVLSVRLLEAAVRELHDQPLLALCFGRPEAVTAFPSLVRGGFQHLSLTALSRKSREKLIRHVLGPTLAIDVVRRIAERSEGNALFLEETVRLANFSTT